MQTVRLARASLFVTVGIAFLAYWVLASPSHDFVRTEWAYVLGFSAVLIALAVALLVLGRMAGGRWVARLSLVAGGGAALSGVANVAEDGLELTWAFWGFVVGTTTVVVALAALTVAAWVTGHGWSRLAAVVPAGTLIGVVGFVEVGGVVMTTTWGVAAVLALVLPASAATPASSSSA
ncbi:MAG: hypothetical protein OEW31_09280 [Thermoleophilia bacterium]|nr:hypothetical protein [Thermoleophilia bacterium]